MSNPKYIYLKVWYVNSKHIKATDGRFLFDERGEKRYLDVSAEVDATGIGDGWMIFIDKELFQPGVAIEMLADGASKELIDLILEATRDDCYAILISEAGEIYDNLPKFDW